MQLYFIRHAESENNALYARTGGWAGRVPDPDITERGKEQAGRLAAFLAEKLPEPVETHVFDPRNGNGFDLTHLYCSPMQRALLTGSELASALRLPLVVWEDLHERGGIFDFDEETEERVGLPGADRTALAARYPQLVMPMDWAEGGWWNRPAEIHDQHVARAERVLSRLQELHGDTEDRVALVSHAGFYQDIVHNLVARAQGHNCAATVEPFWFVLNNAAITRIDFREHHTALVYMNRTDFLPVHLVTS